MVSLEEQVVYDVDDDDNGLRLNVFQNRVENLATVIIPSYLNQLEQQKKNISQYQEDEEWEVMSQEQRNATKTIKVLIINYEGWLLITINPQQLRTHIIELEEVKEQVTPEEHEQLNTIIKPVQTRLMDAVSTFQQLEHQGIISHQPSFWHTKMEAGYVLLLL